jgi:hypothetical protein
VVNIFDLLLTFIEDGNDDFFEEYIYGSSQIQTMFSVEYSPAFSDLFVCIESMAGKSSMLINLNDQETWTKLKTCVKKMKASFYQAKKKLDDEREEYNFERKRYKELVAEMDENVENF